jgi:hypothetical protein
VHAGLLSPTSIQMRPARPVAALDNQLRTGIRTHGPASALDGPVHRSNKTVTCLHCLYPAVVVILPFLVIQGVLLSNLGAYTVALLV